MSRSPGWHGDTLNLNLRAGRSAGAGKACQSRALDRLVARSCRASCKAHGRMLRHRFPQAIILCGALRLKPQLQQRPRYPHATSEQE